MDSLQTMVKTLSVGHPCRLRKGEKNDAKNRKPRHLLIVYCVTSTQMCDRYYYHFMDEK